jgi:hypothetical protein
MRLTRLKGPGHDEHLAALNTGSDQVRRSLAALAGYREFDRPTLLQFSERAEEARVENSLILRLTHAVRMQSKFLSGGSNK